MKKEFNEDLKKKYRSKETEPGHAWHSQSYHRFFEGYEERTIVDDKGHQRIERTYVGNKYERDVDKRKNIIIIISYWLLLVISSVCFIISACMDVAFNHTFYGAIIEMICILMFIFMVVTLINYSFAKKQMTIYEYKSSSINLKIITWIFIVSLFLGAILSILTIILNNTNINMQVLSMVLYLIGILPIFLVNRIEYNLKYKEIKYEGPRNSDASEIEY